MKSLLFIGVMILCCTSYGQYINTMTNEDNYLTNSDGSHVRKTTLFEERGSKFFPQEYCRVQITTTKGKTFKPVIGRIDLQNNTLIYLDNEVELACALPIALLVFDSCNAAKTLFKSGYPAIDKQDEHSLYEVLMPGKATLLKFHFVKWQDVTPFTSTNTTRTYTQVQQHYLFVNGKMLKVEKDRQRLIELLGLTNVPREIGSDIKKEADLMQLIDYYNSH